MGFFLSSKLSYYYIDVDKKHLIINCGSKKTKFIGEVLDKATLKYAIVTLDEVSESDLRKADKIIISGAPILLTEVDPLPYLDKFSSLKELDTPVLGICFGHQILGMLEGGEIQRSEEARSKEIIEHIVPESSLFDKIPQNSIFEEDHCESVTVSKHFILLAKSKSCFNEAMKHKRLKWWGVQFHPEVSQDYGAILLLNWLNLCS